MTPLQKTKYQRARQWYNYKKLNPTVSYREMGEIFNECDVTIGLNVRAMQKHLLTGEPFKIKEGAPQKEYATNKPQVKNKADNMWAALNPNFANGNEYA